MDFMAEGFIKALQLIFTLDREVFGIALVSLKVSGIAITLASVVGIPLGFIMGINEFVGKKTLTLILNTLVALPTVVVGLLVYAILSRQGPLGILGLLFTPTAMIIGQFILALPMVTMLTLSAVHSLDPRVKITALTLGANPLQVGWSVLKEAKYGVISAIIAAFGRVITEVGSAIMVGGNIRGYTRNITTAIALETAKGNFALCMALGMILLIMAFGINIVFYQLQAKKI
ncbi:MAG TPA: ABC transporter permease subunit [Syntrophaceae bacterium]|nr:ABC transporter permease subunit [Syntrophaceae bacterium]